MIGTRVRVPVKIIFRSKAWMGARVGVRVRTRVEVRPKHESRRGIRSHMRKI